MKPSLAETEAIFWEAMTYPTGVADYLKQASPSAILVFEAAFAETPNFSRVERVDVYAEGYFFRLLEVLSEQFPLVVWLLGENEFHNLVTDYLLHHPSQNPNLRRLGDALPEFLRTHSLGSRHPAAVDLSRVELAVDRALDAADGSILRREALVQISPTRWPEMRFKFCPSLCLCESSWDFRRCRDAKQAAEPPPEPADTPLSICVWRKGFTVFTRTLAAGEAAMLRSMLSGASFGDASDAAAKQGVDANQLVHYLSRWLTDEMVAGVEFKGLDSANLAGA